MTLQQGKSPYCISYLFTWTRVGVRLKWEQFRTERRKAIASGNKRKRIELSLAPERKAGEKNRPEKTSEPIRNKIVCQSFGP